MSIEHLVDSSLKTCVYWKPTHTDRYLDYASHHHLSHKRAVVHTLTHRASSHSSQLCDKVRENRRVISSLKFNRYPNAFIVAFKRSPAIVAPTSTSTPEFKGVAMIPYVQGLSEGVQHILTPLQIRVCFRPFLTLRQLLSKPKYVSAVWCSVQDSLCQLSKGVHRTNWPMTLSETD